MNRRNFIIAASGITTIGLLKATNSQSSIALSQNDLDFPSNVDYGYRDEFDVFEKLQINIDSLTISTENIENPENTEVSLKIKTEEQETSIKEKSNIIPEGVENEIPSSGTVNITNFGDIVISLDNIDKDDLNLNNDDEGETNFTLEFTVKHDNEDITRNASDSFTLDIFEITTIREELYQTIPEDEVLEPGFTDEEGTLPEKAYDIIPEDEALSPELSLVD